MAQDLFQYNQMVETAMRGVVRDVLARVSRDGLRGGHHFYIGFATGAPGVEIPESLRARYPEEMVIVIQHQFWGLEVEPEAFSISLSFQSRSERLTIPFAAIRSFADPSVEFGLRFEAPASAAADDAAPQRSEPTPVTALPAPVAAVPEDNAARPAAEVVTLDKFRKR